MNFLNELKNAFFRHEGKPRPVTWAQIVYLVGVAVGGVVCLFLS